MAKNTKSQSVARVPEEGRAKALEAVMAQIDKNYGKGAVMRLGDKEITKTEVISTGAIAQMCIRDRGRSASSAPYQCLYRHRAGRTF